MFRPTCFALIAFAAACGTAHADSVTGTFTSNVAGYNLATTAGTYTVGALRHTWTSNSGTSAAAAAYTGTGIYTFCMDLNPASTGNNTFNLVGVTQAPNAATGNWGNSGQLYTTTQERRVNAIAIAARDLGYLNTLGQFTFNGSTRNDAAVAIQLLVWDSLWESTNGAGWAVESTSAGAFRATAALNTTVTSIIGSLVSYATSHYNDAILVASLSSTGSQDQLLLGYSPSNTSLVPLPPAAYAGMGTLAGVVGLAHVRRRRLARA